MRASGGTTPTQAESVYTLPRIVARTRTTAVPGSRAVSRPV